MTLGVCSGTPTAGACVNPETLDQQLKSPPQGARGLEAGLGDAGQHGRHHHSQPPRASGPRGRAAAATKETLVNKLSRVWKGPGSRVRAAARDPLTRPLAIRPLGTAWTAPAPGAAVPGSAPRLEAPAGRASIPAEKRWGLPGAFSRRPGDSDSARQRGGCYVMKRLNGGVSRACWPACCLRHPAAVRPRRTLYEHGNADSENAAALLADYRKYVEAGSSTASASRPITSTSTSMPPPTRP